MLVVFQVVATYSYNQSTREAVMDILHKVSPKIPKPSLSTEDSSSNTCLENNRQVDLQKLEEVWHMLYSDCLSALEVCVEGDLKHFHKARYMLAKGLYRRNGDGDLERAKEELSFCFKSYRSSFTINMWEIDSMVKKGRHVFTLFACFLVSIFCNCLKDMKFSLSFILYC